MGKQVVLKFSFEAAVTQIINFFKYSYFQYLTQGTQGTVFMNT